MQALQPIACLLMIVLALGWFVWFLARLVRVSVKFTYADRAIQIRWFISLLVWVAVSALASWLGAKNHFVLGGGASVVAFVRFHPNWGVGLVLLMIGLPSAISGFLCSLFWPSHSVAEILLLDSSISVIFTGSIATGYGFFVCGAVSIIWGLIVGEGFPIVQHARNGAPFTVESEAPEHVVQISQSRT
jgi:hypothetical protein